MYTSDNLSFNLFTVFLWMDQNSLGVDNVEM